MRHSHDTLASEAHEHLLNLELQFRQYPSSEESQSAASVFADKIFFVLATASCQFRCEKAASPQHRKSQTGNKMEGTTASHCNAGVKS